MKYRNDCTVWNDGVISDGLQTDTPLGPEHCLGVQFDHA